MFWVKRRDTGLTRAFTLVERMYHATVHHIRRRYSTGLRSVDGGEGRCGKNGLGQSVAAQDDRANRLERPVPCHRSGAGFRERQPTFHRLTLSDADRENPAHDRSDGRTLHLPAHLSFLVRGPMRWFAVLLWLALPVQARDLPLPALFDVAGVAADDVLNIRAMPRATARHIGELRPDATGVEVVRLSENGEWGLVNVGEGAGWASMQFLARSLGQGWDVPPAIAICYGTEPFWSLDPMEAMAFRTPGESLSIDPLTLIRTAGRADPWGVITQTEDGPIHGILTRQACSDGMSDREEGLRIGLIHADRTVYTGCCALTR